MGKKEDNRLKFLDPEIQKVNAEIEKINAERIKLELQAEEIKSKLNRKWYSDHFFTIIIGTIISAAVITGWILDYSYPILHKKREISECNVQLIALKNEINEKKNEIQSQENLRRTKLLKEENETIKKGIVVLLKSNEELQEIQTKSERSAHALQVKLENLSKDYNSLSKKHELSEKQRIDYANLAQGAEIEIEKLKENINQLRDSQIETKERSQRIYLQSILGIWEVYTDNKKNKYLDKIYIDGNDHLQMNRIEISSSGKERILPTKMYNLKIEKDILLYILKLDSSKEIFDVELKIINRNNLNGTAIKSSGEKHNYEFRRFL